MEKSMKRVIDRIAQELQCRVVTVDRNRHYKVTAEHIPTGKTFKMAVPVTPSDYRFAQNQRRDWKRMIATRCEA